MRIAVLGCGWLGFPLAEHLVEEGHEVRGSVTTSEKTLLLAAAGIESFQIDLSARDVSEVDFFLMDADVLIITVPPKYHLAGFDLCTEMTWFLSRVVIQKVPRVLYTSSISVYKDTPELPVYSEEDAREAPTEKAARLLQLENMMLMEEAFQACVLRLGGLLGRDRHPITYLAGRKNLSNPDAPVNLVHLQDCIGVILSLLNGDWFDGVLNVVHPAHPSKRDYYSAAARGRGLSEPHFSESSSIGKIISSEKLQQVIKYNFQVDI